MNKDVRSERGSASARGRGRKQKGKGPHEASGNPEQGERPGGLKNDSSPRSQQQPSGGEGRQEDAKSSGNKAQHHSGDKKADSPKNSKDHPTGMPRIENGTQDEQATPDKTNSLSSTNQQHAPYDRHNKQNKADGKDKGGNMPADGPGFNEPSGSSDGKNPGTSGGKNYTPRQPNSGGRRDFQNANGYDRQNEPKYHGGGGGGGAQQRHQSSNPRTDSNYVHKARIDHQFKSHARQSLHKRPTPIIPVSLDGEPRKDVIANLSKSDISVPSTNLKEIIDRSFSFWNEFPSETARLHVLQKRGVDERKLNDFVYSVYPIVHHTCLQLLWDFLEHKRSHGTNVERKVYAGMDVVGFIDRLMKKRPMSFLGADDRYYLPLPTFKQGFGGFEMIGSEGEKYPLVLEDLLSYDEMRLSALLSLSSWSRFVNDGRRKNLGEKDPDDKFQTEGVIVGQVGARLRKEGVMEYVDCVITRQQNHPDAGFGGSKPSHINAVWGKFWGGDLPTYQDAKACLHAQQGDSRVSPFEYMAVGKENIFNISVYKKRIAITAEILLCEANARAQAYGKKAYVHVVGLGLGVWRAFEEQDDLFIEAWGDALKNIADLSHVAVVDFSFINCYNVHGIKNNEKFPGTDVVIKFSKRNLHDKVPEDHILVCNYAWDGNSLPGNEFWMGKLCSTGDSAAACSSCVAEIHTHSINSVVCGAAVRIATKEGQLLDISDYLKKMQGKSLDLSKLNRYGVKFPCALGRAAAIPKQTQRQNDANMQARPAERLVTPAPAEPAELSNGAWGSTERTSSWAQDADEPVPHPPGAWGSAENTSSWAQDAEQMPAPTALETPFEAPTPTPEVAPAPARVTWPEPPSHNTVVHREQMIPSQEGAAEVIDENEESPVKDVVTASAIEEPKPAQAVVKEVPKEIPHATIPGLTVPNPEYEKQQKELKKAKNKEIKAKAQMKKNNSENKPKEQSPQSKDNAGTSSKGNSKKNNKKK